MKEQERKGRILIVDDKEFMRELMVSILEKDGYVVSTCTSGREGLEKVKEHFYDVIMVKLELPDEKGTDVIAAMHGVRDDSSIVAITSYPAIGAVVVALSRGAYDYISEPFTVETLRMVVARACERPGLIRAGRELELFRRLSIIDELTGLYNYRYFKKCLKREIGRALRYSFPLALMMIDLDNFKIYNDMNGHVRGNAILKRVAHLFRDSTRESDIIARYGGEEFSVILPHTDKEDALELAKRLRDIVQDEKFENEEVLPGGNLTISIGIAACPEEATASHELIALADHALYKAKCEGKDRVCIYSGGNMAVF